VLRFHGDALDRIAWDARGRPPAFRYRFTIPPGGGLASVRVEPLAFPPLSGSPLVIEGESLWPPSSQQGGWAFAEWAGGTCASAGRRLELHRAAEGAPASVTLSLPGARLAGRPVSARIAAGPGARGEVELDGQRVAFGVPEGQRGLACLDLPPIVVSPGVRGSLGLTLRVEPGGAGGRVALDALVVGGAEND
jgi:hypothetical protein